MILQYLDYFASSLFDSCLTIVLIKNGAKGLIKILRSLPLVCQWNGQTTTTLLLLGRYCYWNHINTRRQLKEENHRLFLASLRSSIQMASIPSQTEPWLQTKASSIYKHSAKCGRWRLFTRNSPLRSESAISSRSNLSYSSYGNSKFFEKLQSL